MPLARSFDVLGVLAANPQILVRVVGALAKPQAETGLAATLLESAFGLVEGSYRPVLQLAARKILGCADFSDRASLHHDFYSEAREAFRCIQSYEAWEDLGPWIRKSNPAFGPGIKERFAQASQITIKSAAAARATRRELVAELDALFGDRLAILPTLAGPAPLLNASSAELNSFRLRALSLLVPASLTGRPQITIPVRADDGQPLGISVMGPRGSGLLLCALAERVASETALSREYLDSFQPCRSIPKA